jgi:hypothetical protein
MEFKNFSSVKARTRRSTPVVIPLVSSARDEELADKARQTLVQAERLLLG